MPYIKQNDRENYTQEIKELKNKLSKLDDNDLKGHLNYIIYTLIVDQIKQRGLKYFRAQDLIGGVLTCSQLELYRRCLAPYEDEAIEKNGDI